VRVPTRPPAELTQTAGSASLEEQSYDFEPGREELLGAPRPPTVWPPPQTYAGTRRIAVEMLPGARYRRRHLLRRYSLSGRNPARACS
jgi:hypothetical protein